MNFFNSTVLSAVSVATLTGLLMVPAASGAAPKKQVLKVREGVVAAPASITSDGDIDSGCVNKTVSVNSSVPKSVSAVTKTPAIKSSLKLVDKGDWVKNVFVKDVARNSAGAYVWTVAASIDPGDCDTGEDFWQTDDLAFSVKWATKRWVVKYSRKTGVSAIAGTRLRGKKAPVTVKQFRKVWGTPLSIKKVAGQQLCRVNWRKPQVSIYFAASVGRNPCSSGSATLVRITAPKLWSVLPAGRKSGFISSSGANFLVKTVKATKVEGSNLLGLSVLATGKKIGVVPSRSLVANDRTSAALISSDGKFKQYDFAIIR